MTQYERMVQGLVYDPADEEIMAGLSKFTGADRRFQYKGSYHEAAVIDAKSVAETEAAIKQRLEAAGDKKERKRIEEEGAAELEAAKRKEYLAEQAEWLATRFPEGKYRDVEGLVKAVSLEEIAANDWSLTPGRYVGVAETDDGDEDFAGKFAALHEELRALDAEAADLARKIDANFKELMG